MANLPYTNTAVQAENMLAEGPQRLNIPYHQRLARDDFDDLDLELGELAPRDEDYGDLGQQATSATQDRLPPYAVKDPNTTKRSSITEYRPPHVEHEPATTHSNPTPTKPMPTYHQAATPQELSNVRDMALAYRAQTRSTPLRPAFHFGEGVTVIDSATPLTSRPKRKSQRASTTTTTERSRRIKRCCRKLICPVLILALCSAVFFPVYFTYGRWIEKGIDSDKRRLDAIARIHVRDVPMPSAIATIPASNEDVATSDEKSPLVGSPLTMDRYESPDTLVPRTVEGEMVSKKMTKRYGGLWYAAIIPYIAKTSGATDVWAMVPGWAKVIGPLFLTQIVFFLFL